jgi:MoaA/NifB/PqqE/SkfB family radical SAM enzyme
MAIEWQNYHWHLEPSSICALRCPRCPRTEHPDTPWLNHSITLDFFRSFMPDHRLAQVKRFTMCGDVGDPIYCREYLEIYRYIKQVNPRIHVVTVTNGSGRSPAWWQQFADMANEYDSVNFGIDGHDHDSNNLYRVNSNWNSIMQGIQTLRENNHKVFLVWAMIAFRFNQDHIDAIEQQARSMGMDTLQITRSTKFGSKYGAAYQADQDQLEPRPEWISSSHRYERVTRDLSGRQQPRQQYLAHNLHRFQEVKQQYQAMPIVPLCEIGNRGIYVNAEGVVFPCSWTSFPYHSLTHQDKTILWQHSFFARYRDRMNLKHRSIEDIMADPLWNHCSQGWSDGAKTWVECSQKCSASLVDENYAVGWETN